MTDQIVRLGPEYFPRPTSGVPVAGGSIYIGDPDTDPEIPGNQITVNALQENGVTVPISQPILTGGGGVPLYNGSPVTLLVSESYSLKVLDAFDVQIYYVPETIVTVTTVAATVAYVKDVIGLINVSSPTDDETHTVLSFYDGINEGGGNFYWDSSTDKDTANGGTIVDPDNIGGFDGTTGTLIAYLTAQGTGVGFGCWVRQTEGPTLLSMFGAVGDGVFDDTKVFETVFALGGSIKITKPESKYKTDPLFIISNTHIFIEPGTTIEANTGVADNIPLIYIFEATDVSIDGYGSTVQMLKSEYTTGESRHAVRIQDSIDIRISGVTAKDSGGDGFYIGLRDAWCEDVYLIDVTADNNRRNGISITSAKNVWIVRPKCINTNGTSPQKGVDIEPDANPSAPTEILGFLQNINIVDGYAENNVGPDFSYAGGFLTTTDDISITFEGCIAADGGFQIEASPDNPGFVAFNDCSSLNASGNGFESQSSNMLTYINGLIIRDANQEQIASERYGSAISIFSISKTDGSTYGNIFGRGIKIIDGSGYSVKDVSFYITGEATSIFNEIDLEIHSDRDRIERAGQVGVAANYGPHRDINFVDRVEYARTVDAGTSSMPLFVYSYVTNKGAVASVTLTVDDVKAYAAGTIFKFRVEAAFNFVINAAASGVNIFPGNNSTYTSNDIGSELWIRSDGTKWNIIKEIGTWA